MRRSIVYVGGAGHHLMDQSAAVVADRIARALQDKLRHEQPFSYRIRVESDAPCMAPDIALEIASVQVAKDGGWEPALDILEVQYLPRFTRRFEGLPPFARVLRGFWIFGRSAVRKIRKTRASCAVKTGQHSGVYDRLDRIQATWLMLANLVALGSAFYWLIIGLLTVFGLPAAFNVGFDDILSGLASNRGAEETKSVWGIIATALFLFIAVTLQKTFVLSLDQAAIESFAVMEYQQDDRNFLATHNAILDAIDFASQRGGYGKVDLLSLSLGSILATDTIFPRLSPDRRVRERVWTPPPAIANWITLGYPYDLLQWSCPDYFTEREPAVVEFAHWMNVVVKDDFLGTQFTQDDGRIGVVDHLSQAHLPDLNPDPFVTERAVERGWLDGVVPLRRAVNHRIYWDSEDARAPTCFRALLDVEELDWTRDFLAAMRKTENEIPAQGKGALSKGSDSHIT